MFEDEGSLRRRPRGFAKKKHLKPYSPANGPYGHYGLPHQAFETNGLSASDIPSAYNSQHFTYEYNAPSATTFAEASSWNYNTDLPQYPKMSHTSVHESPSSAASIGSQSSNLTEYHQIYQPAVYTVGYGIESGKLMATHKLF